MSGDRLIGPFKVSQRPTPSIGGGGMEEGGGFLPEEPLNQGRLHQRHQAVNYRTGQSADDVATPPQRC